MAFEQLAHVVDQSRNVHDFRAALAGARRPLLFWDAHGFEIAECVLGAILPEFAPRPHLVIMHDMSDSRHLDPASCSYGGQRLWKGVDNAGPRLKLGTIDSAVAQSVSILDFATLNRLPLHSADHCFHTELAGDAARIAKMQKLLGTAGRQWITRSAGACTATHGRLERTNAGR